MDDKDFQAKYSIYLKENLIKPKLLSWIKIKKYIAIDKKT